MLIPSVVKLLVLELCSSFFFIIVLTILSSPSVLPLPNPWCFSWVGTPGVSLSWWGRWNVVCVHLSPQWHPWVRFYYNGNSTTTLSTTRGMASVIFIPALWFFCFVLLAALGFELMAFCLLARHSTTWATHQVLFAFTCYFILHVGSRIFALGQPQTATILPVAFQHWDDRSTTPCVPYLLRWGFTNFLSNWPPTVILPIHTSFVPRIIDVSHCSWPIWFLREVSLNTSQVDIQ
jgi:hypothetical protein